MRISTFLVGLILLLVNPVIAQEYFVTQGGDDANNGIENSGSLRYCLEQIRLDIIINGVDKEYAITVDSDVNLIEIDSALFVAGDIEISGEFEMHWGANFDSTKSACMFQYEFLFNHIAPHLSIVGASSFYGKNNQESDNDFVKFAPLSPVETAQSLSLIEGSFEYFESILSDVSNNTDFVEIENCVFRFNNKPFVIENQSPNGVFEARYCVFGNNNDVMQIRLDTAWFWTNLFQFNINSIRLAPSFGATSYWLSNNTIVDNGSGLTLVESEYTIYGARLFNNIIFNSFLGADFEIEDPSGLGAYPIRGKNIIGSVGPLAASVYGNPNWYSSQDPSLENARLTEASIAAIDSGLANNASEFDLEGVAWNQNGELVDIGCYSFSNTYTCDTVVVELLFGANELLCEADTVELFRLSKVYNTTSWSLFNSNNTLIESGSSTGYKQYFETSSQFYLEYYDPCFDTLILDTLDVLVDWESVPQVDSIEITVPEVCIGSFAEIVIHGQRDDHQYWFLKDSCNDVAFHEIQYTDTLQFSPHVSGTYYLDAQSVCHEPLCIPVEILVQDSTHLIVAYPDTICYGEIFTPNSIQIPHGWEQTFYSNGLEEGVGGPLYESISFKAWSVDSGHCVSDTFYGAVYVRDNAVDTIQFDLCIGDTAFYADTFFTHQGIFPFVVASQIGCDSGLVIDVQRHNFVDFQIQQDYSSPVCEGALVHLSASGQYSFTWSHGLANGDSFEVFTSNTYTVTAEAGACTQVDSIEIYVHETAFLTNARWVQDSFVCYGDEVIIEIEQSAEGLEYYLADTLGNILKGPSRGNGDNLTMTLENVNQATPLELHELVHAESNFIEFKELGDHIEITADSVPNANEAFSLGLWLKPTSFNYLSNMFLKMGNQAYNGAAFGLTCTGSGQLLLWQHNASYLSNVVLKTNEWQHLAVTYDGAVLRFYLNGELVDETIRALTTNADNHFYLGSNPDRAGWQFDGAMADFKLFNSSKNALQVQSEIIALPGFEDLSLMYHFDFSRPSSDSIANVGKATSSAVLHSMDSSHFGFSMFHRSQAKCGALIAQFNIALLDSFEASLTSNFDSICSGDNIVLTADIGHNNSDSLVWKLQTATMPFTSVAHSDFTIDSLGSNYLELHHSNYSGALQIALFAYRCGALVATSDTMSIELIARPTLNAGIDDTFCYGSSYTFHANSNSSVQWLSEFIEQDSSYTLIETNSYVVLAMGKNACNRLDTLHLSVREQHYTQYFETICSGDSALIRGVYYSSNVNLIDTVSGPLCDTIINTVVELKSLPNVFAGSEESYVICQGDSLLLQGFNADTLIWSNGVENGNSYLPHQSEQLVLLGTNAFGCVARDTVQVVLLANISQAAYVIDSSVNCYGNSVSIVIVEPQEHVVYSLVDREGNQVGEAVHGAEHNVLHTPLIESATFFALRAVSIDTQFNTENCSAILYDSIAFNFDREVRLLSISDSIVMCDGEQSELRVEWDQAVSVVLWERSIDEGASYDTLFIDSGKVSVLQLENKAFEHAHYLYRVSAIECGAILAQYGDISVDVYPRLSASASIADSFLFANNYHTSYQWINCDLGIELLGDTNQMFVPQATGNYAVIVANEQCVDTSICYYFDIEGDHVEAVAHIDSITLSTDEICEGETVQITIHGQLNDASTWRVYDQACFANLITSTSSNQFEVSPQSFTTYYIVGEGDNISAGNCYEVSVDVHATPRISLVSPITVCEGDEVVLNAGSSDSIYWSEGYANGDVYLPQQDEILYVDAISEFGCVSNDSLQIDFIATSYSSLEITLCEGQDVEYNGQVYNSAGIYDLVYESISGCDSILELTVNISSAQLNLGFTNDGGRLTALQENASYQWFECVDGNEPIAIIPGANGRTFIPDQVGNYGVAVEKGGCYGSSFCSFVDEIYTAPNTSVGQISSLSNMVIYPNPNKGHFQISHKGAEAVLIRNMQGQVVYEHLEVMDPNLNLNLSHLSAGLYSVEMRFADKLESQLIQIIK